MKKISNVDLITIADIKNLQSRVVSIQNILQWKDIVSRFAKEHDISEKEAIQLASIKLPKLIRD